ncbi:hypothetical protein [[Eubacterium] hominis]|uniref:hypothetical protein n=1 Tax=[Eubacterium] hominis TaxID=2764325 RepID=UPI003A4D6E43
MALKTKLNTNDEGNNGLDVMDDLDAVYVDNLKASGLDESLLTQFASISKELEEKKDEKK